MNKYQKLTVVFCMLGAASIMFGQAVKTSFTYAPSVGFFSSVAFNILGLYAAFKSYKKQ